MASEIVIHTEQGDKGRSFSASLLAAVYADMARKRTTA